MGKDSITPQKKITDLLHINEDLRKQLHFVYKFDTSHEPIFTPKNASIPRILAQSKRFNKTLDKLYKISGKKNKEKINKRKTIKIKGGRNKPSGSKISSLSTSSSSSSSSSPSSLKHASTSKIINNKSSRKKYCIKKHSCCCGISRKEIEQILFKIISPAIATISESPISSNPISEEVDKVICETLGLNHPSDLSGGVCTLSPSFISNENLEILPKEGDSEIMDGNAISGENNMVII